MDAELAPLLAEHHAHAARGGSTSRKTSGFDALVEDLASADARLRTRGPTMRKAVPAAPVVPMKNLVGELEAMVKSASASAEAAARRAAEAREAQRRVFQERFAKAHATFGRLVAEGRLTGVQAAILEGKMAQLGRAAR